MSLLDQQKNNYRGRFAPSPTGPLHLGSLTTALGSYLDARSNKGEWLLRIEDIDPPREEPSARELIPNQLEQHGLYWDGAISYQSDHARHYRECLTTLSDMGMTYRCNCSRQRIKALGGSYDRHCLNTPSPKESDSAIRLITEKGYEWEDPVQGRIRFSPSDLGGDFVIHRKDGLFSYQLAVAADDHAQGITHVVRGADLLDSTARQALIMHALGWTPPSYAHLPLILANNGQKLSKQNHAPILNAKTVVKNLYDSLQLLGQNPPSDLLSTDRDELLSWASDNWHLSKVPQSNSPA